MPLPKLSKYFMLPLSSYIKSPGTCNTIPLTSHLIYEDNDNIKYLDSLGRGISNTVKLIWSVYRYKPDILLIDDLETLGLRHKRLQTLLRWFKEYIRDGKLKAMLFTTNSDTPTKLALLYY